jgi:hypothetical protein
MKRHAKPTLALVVWGDWHSIIAVREYREQLIDQKPWDEDDGDYKSYNVPCANTAELVKAYEAFKGFRRSFCIKYRSDEWSITAATEDGYSNDGAFVVLEVDDSVQSGKVFEAAKKAAEILKEAIK